VTGGCQPDCGRERCAGGLDAAPRPDIGDVGFDPPPGFSSQLRRGRFATPIHQAEGCEVFVEANPNRAVQCAQVPGFND
jgi:hypothetical protein